MLTRVVSCLLLVLAGCERDQSSPVANTALPTASAPSVDERTGSSLAKLSRFQPRVTWRRRKNLVWREAEPGVDFYPFDAVKTHDSASADVSFLMGSSIHLSENSFVIIRPPFEPRRTNVEIATVRQGTVSARTSRELWLVTSAALLRLRGEGDHRVAHAVVDVVEGKNLRLELKGGTGTVVPSSRPGVFDTQAVKRLIRGKAIVLSAPVAVPAFGAKEEDVTLPTTAQLDQAERALASVRKPSAIDFRRLSPQNYSETTQSLVEISGALTAAGGKILINGKLVPIDKSLGFRTKIALSAGPNSIVIQLNQPDGTVTHRRLMVVRKQ